MRAQCGMVKVEPWDSDRKIPTRRPWVIFLESLADPHQRHPRDEKLPGCQAPLRSETVIRSNCLGVFGFYFLAHFSPYLSDPLNSFCMFLVILLYFTKFL